MEARINKERKNDMKTIAIIFVWLALVCGVTATSNYIDGVLTITRDISARSNKFYSVADFHIGGVIISEDGMVTIPNGMTLDEVSISFWKAIKKMFNQDTESLIRKLAKDGEICKMFGHSWGETYHPKKNHGGYLITDWNTWVRKCHICGKVENRSMGDWN